MDAWKIPDEKVAWWQIEDHVINVTGCLKPCQYIQYELELDTRATGTSNNVLGCIRTCTAYPTDPTFPGKVFSNAPYDAGTEIYAIDKNTEFVEEFQAFDELSLIGEVQFGFLQCFKSEF